MDRFLDYNAVVFGATGLVPVLVSFLVLYILGRKSGLEAPVPYNVTPPEQARPGWKGEVLDEPSLKVPYAVH